MAKKITEEEKEKIIKLYGEGNSVASISEQTGRSESAITRIIKSIPAGGSEKAQEEHSEHRLIESSLPESQEMQDPSFHELSRTVSESGIDINTLLEISRKLFELHQEEGISYTSIMDRLMQFRLDSAEEPQIVEEPEAKEETRAPAELDSAQKEAVEDEYQAKYRMIKLSEDILEAIGSSNMNDVAMILRSLSTFGFDFRKFMRLSEALDYLGDKKLSLKEFMDSFDLITTLKEWGFDLPVLNHISSVLGIEKKSLRKLIDEYLEYNRDIVRHQKYISERQEELADLRKLRDSVVTQISRLKGKRNHMSDEIGELKSSIKGLNREKGELERYNQELRQSLEEQEYRKNEEVWDNRQYIEEILRDLDKYAGKKEQETDTETQPVGEENTEPNGDSTIFTLERRIIDIGFSVYEEIRKAGTWVSGGTLVKSGENAQEDSRGSRRNRFLPPWI